MFELSKLYQLLDYILSLFELSKHSISIVHYFFSLFVLINHASIFYFHILFLQKRQGQSNSKSRSEKFNPHPEEVASGFPIDPPRPSQTVEGTIESQEHHHKRASHSGPLAHRTAWAKASKNLDDAAKISTGADLSTMSGLVEARRMSEDRRQRSSSSQPEVAKFIGRFPGSFKESSEFSMQQDQKHHTQGIVGSHKKEDAKISNKDPILVSSFCPPLIKYISFSFKVLQLVINFHIYLYTLRIYVCTSQKNVCVCVY